MTNLFSKTVYVTGMGIISGIGKNVHETFQSLVEQNSGIGRIKYLETAHKDKFLVSEVPYSNAELELMCEIDEKGEHPRTTLLAYYAAKQALDAISYVPDDGLRTGLIFATTVGGMDHSEKYYRGSEDFIDFITNGQNKGYSTELLANLYHINDYVTTITTACSSSANAIALGADLIKCNYLDRVVVGGADSLCKFTINGFNTLMILSDEKCKPFDKFRNGLNLGEGAGFIVLESEETLKNSGNTVYAKLTGCSNKNDAHHQTATSDNGEGPYLCMQEAIEMAGLQPQEVGYINAHGTGTPNNDLTESVAIQRIFGNNHPPFASLKPFIGHTLGAAGIVEAIISIICLNQNKVIGSLNQTVNIEEVSALLLHFSTSCYGCH